MVSSIHDFIEPMFPTLVDKPPERGDWLTEVKFDGWRCQIVIENSKARVLTRRGHDWTDRLKPIADAADNLDAGSATIDGELVYPHESGRSDFAALQASVRSAPDRLVFMAFDLLCIERDDLRNLPVEHRRYLLEKLILPGERLQFSEALTGTPADIFAAAEAAGLEGIVCKRLGSPYRSGTTTNWLKVKCFIESDLELLGVQRETGKPTMALLGEIGTRRYVGSAFVVFARPASEEFKAMVDANPGSPPPDLKRKSKELVQWLRPGIVGRVRHLRGEDKLRHATLVAVAQSGFYDI